MVKKIFLLGLLSLLMGCEQSQAETFKGVIFMTFIDDFERGKSTQVFEIQLSDSKKMRTLIFKEGEPPKEFGVIFQPGKEVKIKGKLQEDGTILYEGLPPEQT